MYYIHTNYYSLIDMWWSVFFVLLNYKNGRRKKEHKRRVIPAIVLSWCLKQTIAHGWSVPYSNIYTIKKKNRLIIEHLKGVFTLQPARYRSRLFSAMAKRKLIANLVSFSIFNLKVPRP